MTPRERQLSVIRREIPDRISVDAICVENQPQIADFLGIEPGKSCGNITQVLPDLIDIGMDVWETVQLHTLPMSPKQLKREYGRHITFFGGINTQRLPFATPEEVRSEVLECIKILGRDSGYICGPDHHIKPDVSLENTVALFDAAMGCASN